MICLPRKSYDLNLFRRGENMSRIAAKVLTLAVLVFFISSLNVFSQKPTSTKDNPSTINWQRYDQGLEQAKKEKKKLMVFFYTDWCGWCKRMNSSTYTDEEVKKLLAKDFVSIKVNGDSQNMISVDSAKITEKQLTSRYVTRGFPTLCFLESNAEKIFCQAGYLDARQLSPVLGYLGDDWYKKLSFDEYLKKKDELTKEKKEEGKTKSKK